MKKNIHTLLNESIKKSIITITEEHSPAFERKQAKSEGMKHLWNVIDKKQQELYNLVFGKLSDKLDILTQEKSKLMGDEYLNIPKVICKAGNDKLPENVLIINMSSALMCPSFYLGLCTIRNGACYAQKDENQYSNNVLPQRWKTDLMHTQMLRQYQNGNKKPMRLYFNIIELYINLANKYSTDLFKEKLKEAELRKRKPLEPEYKKFLQWEHSKTTITDVRLNETGDFHCQLAVDLWAKFAKKIRKKYGIETHAYTARNLDFSNAAQYINMNYSHNGKYDSEYQKPRYFQVISNKAYNELQDTYLDDAGQPVLQTNKKGIKYYKCPCVDNKSQCGYCGVCYKPNKTNETYTIYVKLHGSGVAKGLKNGFTIQEVKPIIDTYQKINWIADDEKGKSDNKSLQDYSQHTQKNRKKSPEKIKHKSNNKT